MEVALFSFIFTLLGNLYCLYAGYRIGYTKAQLDLKNQKPQVKVSDLYPPKQ